MRIRCLLERMGWADRCTAVALLALLVVMPLLSLDYGITCDEPDHYDYGRLALDFYASGFQDRASFSYKFNYLNGAVFDLGATLLQKIFSGANPYTVRHVCNALAGWLGILFTGLLARRCFGPGAGLLAVLFMALTPRFMGHAMNNPKDVPFAAGYAFVLYSFTFFRNRYPFATWKGAALMVAAVALLLNVRVGGLLTLGYAGLLLGWLVLRDRDSWKGGRLLRLGAGFAGAALLALVLGTLFWPWALANPLLRPLEALVTVSKYPWTGKVLLAGTLYDGDALPWFYIPMWYAVTTPLSLLAGLGGALLLLARSRERMVVAALLFVTLFPVAYVIIKGAVLYNGLRHLLFILPPLVVLAAGAWSRGFTLFKGRWARAILAVLLVAGLAHAAFWSVRLHPYQTLYFNELVGGPREALHQYDMDYWGNSYKEALERVKAGWHSPRPVKVFAPEEMCGQIVEAYAMFDPELESVADPGAADRLVTLNLMLFENVVQGLVRQPQFETVWVAGRPLCLIQRLR